MTCILRLDTSVVEVFLVLCMMLDQRRYLVLDLVLDPSRRGRWSVNGWITIRYIVNYEANGTRD
jgi:hypothetical protein